MAKGKNKKHTKAIEKAVRKGLEKGLSEAEVRQAVAEGFLPKAERKNFSKKEKAAPVAAAPTKPAKSAERKRRAQQGR